MMVGMYKEGTVFSPVNNRALRRMRVSQNRPVNNLQVLSSTAIVMEGRTCIIALSRREV